MDIAWLNFGADLSSLVEVVNYPFIALFMFVGLLTPLPSEAMMPLVGYLVHLGQLNFWLAPLVGALGSLMASLLLYIIGRYGGPPLVDRYGKYIGLRPRDLERTERFFAKYGRVSVALAQLLPAIRAFISLPAGFSKMPVGEYCAFAFLGAFLWDLLLVYLGMRAGEHWMVIGPEVQNIVLLSFIGLIVIVMAGLLIWWLVRMIRQAKRRR